MKTFLKIGGLILLLIIIGQFGYVSTRQTEAAKTLEQAAADSCAWKGNSVRDLIKTSQRTGLSTETVETWEFAVCVGQEKAVLEEEVRRGFRPAFAEKTQKKTQETELKMSCPPSQWMTADGCQKAITAGGLSR